MTTARIYKPAKTAMQSGKARTREWVLEFEPSSARLPDPLMGWQQSMDMNGQVELYFDTPEEAVAYAQKCGIPFQLVQEKKPKAILKAYSDNFAFNRKQPWTH